MYSQSCATRSTINFKTFSSPHTEALNPSELIPHRLPTTSPRQPLIYIVSLWIFLFWTFHINTNKQYWGLLWQASFTWNTVFKDYLWGVMHFISFYCWIIFHYMDISHFIYLFNSWRTFGLFPLFDYHKQCCHERLNNKFVWTSVFISFGIYLGVVYNQWLAMW